MLTQKSVLYGFTARISVIPGFDTTSFSIRLDAIAIRNVSVQASYLHLSDCRPFELPLFTILHNLI